MHIHIDDIEFLGICYTQNIYFGMHDVSQWHSGIEGVVEDIIVM